MPRPRERRSCGLRIVRPADAGASSRFGPTARAVTAAAAAGVAYTIACPPYPFAIAAWLVPGLVLVPCRGLSARRAALAGLMLALVMGYGVCGWAFHASLDYFDSDRTWAAAFVLLVWLLYGGIQFGLACAAYARLAPRLSPIARAPFAAWLWAAIEWLRATLFTGMPWELIGHTQYRALGLVQIADLGGVYAVSFVVALGSVAVAELVRDGWRARPAEVGWRVAPACVLLVAAWVYGSAAAARYGVASEPATRIAIVQGNVANAFRWQRAHMERTLATYVGLTETTRAAQPDLVVWPENAVDFYLEREPLLRTQLARAAALAPGGLLIGSPRLAADREARNSAQLLGNDGTILARYDKQHLVPFAEESLLRVDAALASEPVYGPGPQADPIPSAVGPLGVMICYEVIFPGLVRDLVRRGAEVLVNLSNDSWLDAGSGAALEQHFSMAVFRAIETRRDLVRVAGSGVSGFIDAFGRVRATIPRGTAGARVEPVVRRTGLTPYVRFGDAWILLGGVAVVVGLRRRGREAPR
jgi:apolipoprotein N-acyltransferase